MIIPDRSSGPVSGMTPCAWCGIVSSPASTSGVLRRHLRSSSRTFVREWEALQIELRDGFTEYREIRRRAGSNFVTKELRKRRKLEREIGPVRFVEHTLDPDAFTALLAWKSEQRRRTKTVDILQRGWAVDALDRIRTIEMEGFSGCFSALYAGDHLLAVHLGMRSHGVLHHWFPAFDRAFGKYSPGILLLIEMTRAFADRGVTRIDLGKRGESYKDRVATASNVLTDVTMDRSPILRVVTEARYRTRSCADGSVAGEHLRQGKRLALRCYHSVAGSLGRSPAPEPTRPKPKAPGEN